MTFRAGNRLRGDGLRFATDAEARAYGHDLEWRWTLVREMRVAPSDEPVNCHWDFETHRTVHHDKTT